MVSRNLAKAAMVIFLITTIGAAFITLYAYQQPLERVETTTIATYAQTGAYTYVAELFPNVIYNTTVIGPDEGKLYQPILSHVNISFNYTFTGTPAPTNLSETHYTQVEIASTRWTKTLSSDEALDWLALNMSELGFTIFLNATRLNEIFDVIDGETASSSSQYNITVSPFIFQRATVGGEAIYEVLNPTLNINFRQDAGSYIDITPLRTVDQGSITNSVTIRNTWVDSLRNAGIAGVVISAIALFASLALYYRSKPVEVKPTIEKLTSPHKDIIVDTAQMPPATKAVVETSSLDDLVRTAEVLARPIMHSVAGNEHTFFILDGETKYQYKVIS